VHLTGNGVKSVASPNTTTDKPTSIRMNTGSTHLYGYCSMSLIINKCRLLQMLHAEQHYCWPTNKWY